MTGRAALVVLLGAMVISPAGFAGSSIKEPSQGALNTPDEPIDVLFRQANFWESRHRGDLARLVLQRILDSKPGDNRALYELGISYSKEGNIEQARNVLKRMLASNQASKYSSSLTEHIKNSTFDQTRLNRARQLQAGNQHEEAVLEYEHLFLGREKVGPVALELYHSMSSIPDRWEEAVDGLEHMLATDPSNGDIRFTLAQVLTYKEASRRKGLDQLRELSANPKYRERALGKYGEAVLWLQASTEDAQYFRYYVDANPDDARVRNRLQTLTLSVDPNSFDGLLMYGFEALRRNQLDKAKKFFNQAAQVQKKNGEAWAGLALVEQRKGLHDAAIRLYGEAVKRDPAIRSKYREAIASAEFWNAINQLGSDQYKSNPEQAIQFVEGIEARSADERTELALARSQLLIASKKYDQAAKVLQGVLSNSPEEERAIISLIDVSLMSRNYRDLADLVARYSYKSNSASTGKELAVSLLRAEGLLAISRSQTAKALAAFERGLDIDQNAIWLRLDYARLLLKLGREHEADRVISKISVFGPDKRNASHAKALFYMEREDWQQVLSILDLVPEAAADDQLKRLRLAAEFRRSIEQAVAQGELRGPKTAEQALIGLYETAPRVEDRALLIVNALAAFDLRNPAMAIIGQALREDPDPGVDAKLAFAGYLIGWDDFSKSDEILADLETGNVLNARQRISLSALKLRSLQAQSSYALENGAYSRARIYLDAALKLDSRNPQTFRMLGQLSQLQGDLNKSVAYYREAIAIQPKDLWAIKGAVGSALEAGNLAVSREVLDDAMDQLPDEPEIYELVARVAQTAGETKMALDAMAYARALRK